MYVLIVDDDQGIRRFLRLVLEDAGHRVAVAENGLEALRQIQCACPDVLLLDLAMPVMSGQELQDHLRRSGPTIPVVFMSAGGHVADEARIHAADAFLAKPFELADLFQTLTRVLRQTEMRVRSSG